MFEESHVLALVSQDIIQQKQPLARIKQTQAAIHFRVKIHEYCQKNC
jgi:hypothetical protein